MTTNTAKEQLMEVASRIKEMREIMGWSIAEMATKTEVSEQQYIEYENANVDFPFTFIPLVNTIIGMSSFTFKSISWANAASL